MTKSNLKHSSPYSRRNMSLEMIIRSKFNRHSLGTIKQSNNIKDYIKLLELINNRIK